jgi:hypothetical protein
MDGREGWSARWLVGAREPSGGAAAARASCGRRSSCPVTPRARALARAPLSISKPLHTTLNATPHRIDLPRKRSKAKKPRRAKQKHRGRAMQSLRAGEPQQLHRNDARCITTYALTPLLPPSPLQLYTTTRRRPARGRLQQQQDPHQPHTSASRRPRRILAFRPRGALRRPGKPPSPATKITRFSASERERARRPQLSPLTAARLPPPSLPLPPTSQPHSSTAAAALPHRPRPTATPPPPPQPQPHRPTSTSPSPSP